LVLTTFPLPDSDPQYKCGSGFRKCADFEDLNDSEIETELKWEEEKSNERIKARKV